MQGWFLKKTKQLNIRPLVDSQSRKDKAKNRCHILKCIKWQWCFTPEKHSGNTFQVCLVPVWVVDQLLDVLMENARFTFICTIVHTCTSANLSSQSVHERKTKLKVAHSIRVIIVDLDNSDDRNHLVETQLITEGKKTCVHLVYQTISYLTFTEFLTLWFYTHWPPNGSRLGKPGRGRTPSSDLCLLIVRATRLLMFSTCSDFLCLLARFKRESRPVVQVVQLFLVPFPRYSGGWGTGRASLSHLVMDPPGWDVVRRATVWAHISPHRRFTLEKFRCQ